MIRILLLLLVGLVAAAASLEAQIDYRNLDHGRPFAVEDAYPVERYGFDFSAGYGGRSFGSGGSLHLFMPELAYGLANSTHLAIGLPWVLSAPGRAGSTGLAGMDLSLLANLSTETVRLPGLALRVDASLPTGSMGGAGAGVSVRGLATRSFGRQRIHLNAAVALAAPRDPGLREDTTGWWLGAAIDRTLIRTSTLLIGEATISRPDGGAPLAGTVGIGVRRQLAPALVLDAGIASQLQRSRSAAFSVTLGLSHSFGIAALMSGGPR